MTEFYPLINNSRRRSSAHHSFISTKTVANVLSTIKQHPYRPLIDLPVRATIEETLDLLLAEDIISVPVYRCDNNKKHYITIVSALDLLKWLSNHTDLETLQSTRDIMLSPLSEAIGMTDESSRLVTIRPTDSLESVIALLSNNSHRVLVQGENTPVLLSQMDIVKYLHSHNHQLGAAILDLTVPTIVEKALARRHHDQSVISINFKTTALDAFVEMAHRQIGALPIVDDTDTLVADISPKDLRGLNRNRFDTLAKPVIIYLKTSHGELCPPFTCHERFTLSQIMAAFVLRKAQRIWWCNQDGRLNGVITLSDFLGTFIDEI
ncbi:uncharacterized protein BYT42DRAFT_549776 [Radiomyces spectabilis]|uniref:uncharacterized protein n=1 Tax=Radiomyces spectabilis TaxID=64574 RepID=UPI00221E67BD|nr:uncharacterized protein BYT42DRAFT_549776 [Radiomyces spectabilis]KAI8366694.1 hypothetical protein BYT42DRAFT_549776 [Radiomyces spectabilis]